MGTDQRSVLVHQMHSEEMGQFDRFVLGATLAGCAYLGQTIPYGQVGMNVSTLFLFSLLILGMSAYFGFKRIEVVLMARRANSNFLHLHETNRPMEAHLAGGVLERAAARTETYYRLRNWTLLLGFVVYVATKVLATY